ncbi:MAG: hypothetical protein ACRDEA_12995 [Microcystaceae cyanobacterium]
MKPKFKDILAWEQAQLLMQPAFIRIIDNIRKQLDESTWQGTYQEVQTPYPGYLLCLTNQERSVEVDVWNLCFQVCFRDYNLQQTEVSDNGENAVQEVEIDTSLIDETGDVDWQRLETKAQQLVRQTFANLPS